MPDESLPVRRKIGFDRGYDRRQHATDALSRRRNVGFRHRASVAAVVPAATRSHATRLPLEEASSLQSLIGPLFLFQERQVGFVTSVFHFFLRNEMEGARVNGVHLSGGRFRVGKEM